jgi:hypothetical protein
MLNLHESEPAGKFVHTDGRAVNARRPLTPKPEPGRPEKAGWFTPGGTIYQRTVPRSPR